MPCFFPRSSFSFGILLDLACYCPRITIEITWVVISCCASLLNWNLSGKKNVASWAIFPTNSLHLEAFSFRLLKPVVSHLQSSQRWEHHTVPSPGNFPIRKVYAWLGWRCSPARPKRRSQWSNWPRRPWKRRRPRVEWRIRKVVVWLGGGLKYFLFSSLFGEMIQFDSYFSKGWNHQLDDLGGCIPDGMFIHEAPGVFLGVVTLRITWGGRRLRSRP